MLIHRRWNIREHPAEDVALLAERLGVSPITARILFNRDLRDPDRARSFLSPTLSALQDPMTSAEVRRAAERLAEAARKGEKITVYGDYDVDGITATCLLVRCLRCAGLSPEYYVPVREDEGYGLNADAIRQIRARGTDLLVTVDCGITALDEARLAAELGLSLIITDHHEPGPELPAAAAVVNPKCAHTGLAFRELCGAGVAFKLAWAFARVLSGSDRVAPEFRDFLISAVSLVCLGTIADVVPLQGENRIFAHYGLRALVECEDAGVRALLDVAGLTGRTLCAYDIAFKVAPRLNAAGRLGDAREAVELLLKDSYGEALPLAEELDRRNILRQKVQSLMLDEALALLGQQFAPDRDSFIVLASEDWRRGVVGICASKIAEQFWRPTVLLAIEDGIARGSGRSVAGFNLYAALDECRGILMQLGGHAKAAGLTLDAARIDEFRRAVNEVTARRWPVEERSPSLDIDAAVRLGDISPGVLREIDRLAPFGETNRRPVLASHGLRVVGAPQIIGSSQRHLEFLVRQEDTTRRAVAFNAADMIDEVRISKAGFIDLAYEPKRNDRNDEVELIVKDVQFKR